jgi:hypothetical protein
VLEEVTMVLRRIGPLSLAKISGVVYAMVGLIAGCFLALFSLVGGLTSENAGGPFYGLFFGAGALVFMPLFYGGIGFVGSLLMAAIYNLVAGWTGGVQLSLEDPAARFEPPVGA